MTENAGLPVYLLVPPYEEFIPVRSLERLRRERPVDGTLVVIRVSHGADWDSVAKRATDLLRYLPASPVILRLDLIPRRRAIALFARAYKLGIRAELSGPDPDLNELHEQLTRADDFARQLPRWLAWRGVNVSPDMAGLLRRLVQNSAIPRRGLAQIARSRGRSEDTWARRFGETGLAYPGRWVRVLRAIRCALQLQRRPDQSIESIVLRAGYYDAAAFRKTSIQMFDRPPGELRQRLGWEWILWKACSRYGLAPGATS